MGRISEFRFEEGVGERFVGEEGSSEVTVVFGLPVLRIKYRLRCALERTTSVAAKAFNKVRDQTLEMHRNVFTVAQSETSSVPELVVL